jgi:hypothetical protein
MMQVQSAAVDAATPPVLELSGARATIRLNRPKHLNRLQAEDLEILLSLFDRIEADPAIRVLVVTGTGRAFSAGYDLNSVAERAVSADEKKSAGSAFEVVVNRLEDLRVPTICRLNGGVYGGSTDLALACDFRIGVDTSEMFMPAARLGLHYYKSGIARYVSRLGVDNAKKLFLTAQKDRRRGDVADRLFDRDGAGGRFRRRGRSTRGQSCGQCAGRDARHETRDQRVRPRRARRGSRRPACPRQHAQRRDQRRHQGVCGKAPAEVLDGICLRKLSRPHPEERPLGRVSKDGAALVLRDGASAPPQDEGALKS